MKFTPKTDKEIEEERLLPEGEYDFQISAGEDKVSKSGNEMIELLVRVYKPDGSGFILVNDYLLESVLYKVSHAAKACGLETEYNNGNLHGDDFFGKTGKLKLGIQKDKNGQYPDKNVIKDYIVSGEEKKSDPQSPTLGKAKKEPEKSIGEELNDEIPF